MILEEYFLTNFMNNVKQHYLSVTIENGEVIVSIVPNGSGKEMHYVIEGNRIFPKRDTHANI